MGRSTAELERTVAQLTRELNEAREEQSATADVLQTMSRSAFKLDAVLTTLIRSAIRLCAAARGVIWLREGELLVLAAHVNYSAEWVAFAQSSPIKPAADAVTMSGLAAFTGEVINVEDVLSDPRFRLLAAHKLGDYRGGVAVPLKRDGRVEGVISLSRAEVGRFSERQLALLLTFADQAVIAIENVRLFRELEARNRDVSEALQQQTATADVLKVISRSTFNLHSVLQTLIESACRLCDAEKGGIYMLDGDIYRLAANHGMTAELVAHEALNPNRVGRDTFVGRTALEKAVVHVPDVTRDLEYGMPELPKLGGFKAILSVPLMREGSAVGVFSMGRPDPGPFTDRQVELVQTFADQAVIAIENIRLFEEVEARTTELSEALQQQTATADVLKVISQSAFDLDTVLETLVQTAARLCGAGPAQIFRREGDVYRYATSRILNPEYRRIEEQSRIPAGRGSLVGRVALEKRAVQIEDAWTDPEYELKDDAHVGNIRSMLGVPLLLNGEPIGAFALAREYVERFSEKQVELVTSFADQAVIAIENARLFTAVQNRTEELSRSLEELRTAQGRLVQTEKLASLGQLTAGIAHEIKNPLNFVNNFSSLSGELIEELREMLADAPLDEKRRADVAELTEMLKSNLEKVVQHGKRADSIVKNMLLHSREGSGERRRASINAIVEESLNLAYHGARAEKQGFNITMEKSLDPMAGEVDLFPQEITRVLLNLISNGFYAATKRKAGAGGAGYEPILTAATRNLGDSVEIRIRDNGTGIPAEVKEKMFNPFFTTKPAGEGTGLGLSLSHDIVVKQHAGTIAVETEPGAFTEFRIVLPRHAEPGAKAEGAA